MVGQFAARSAFTAAQRLEDLGRAGDLREAESTCAALERAVERLRPVLTGLLDEGEQA
jgi:hypothetical protein